MNGASRIDPASLRSPEFYGDYNQLARLVATIFSRDRRLPGLHSLGLGAE